MDRVQAGNELSFRIGFSGHSGHLRMEPLSTVERSNPISSLPDFILPPAFPRETTDSIREHIEEKYLTLQLDDDELSPETAGKQWDFDWFERVKFSLEPSLPRSVIVPKWEDPFRRKMKDGIWEPESVEMDVSELMEGAQDCASFLRFSGLKKDSVIGSINNRPFRPGGLEDSQCSDKILPDGASNGKWVQELLNGGPIQTTPPILKRGLDLGDFKVYPSSWNVYTNQGLRIPTSDVTPIALSVHFDDLFKKAWEEDVAEIEADGKLSDLEYVSSKTEVVKVDEPSTLHFPEISELDEILLVEPREVTPRSGDTPNVNEKQQKDLAVNGDWIANHFYELVPDTALNFPFELDGFQKEAIYYLEKGESVFVAAHTSAGKTVVAEYAFALSSKHCTRAVYTAPIKTISNQKYRDFSGKFDVGLLTGDVSVRPDASCLIMTTEILRSMLYRGADLIRDIEWVIFDEVHYINDVERGVVWEEVIIMLPKHVNIVLLSATVPNANDFAEWIGRTKQKKIRVTGTTKRPVPLEHCIFYGRELYKICEAEKFMPDGLKAAKDADKKKSSIAAGGGGGFDARSSTVHNNARAQKNGNPNHGQQNKHSGFHNSSGSYGNRAGNQNDGNSKSNWSSRRSEASLWFALINKLSKKSLLPVVIFCFSKNRCDKSADNISGTDLTSSSEKSEIRIFCDKAFSRLKGSDRNLPQIVRVQSLLHRGIGVHHAGLLPIVKEVVEMLFCRGVIKVLFSTETFAMGVNAPARTVVFDTLRKFDGREFRQLLPGEYTQMAGRAGRRGLDSIGTVIIMCRDEIPEAADLTNVIVGNAKKLESQFRLTYIMIMHLLRVEELKVEDMLKRSFAEFHAQTMLPKHQQILMLKLSQPARKIECIKGEPSIKEYYDMYSKAETHNHQITEAVMLDNNAQKFLTPGRVVVVKSQSAQDHLLGVVVKAASVKAASASMKQYIVLVLRPDLPATTTEPLGSANSQNSSSGDFGQGYMLLPKAKRGFDDEYIASAIPRKGSGVVNITLPYYGTAAGVRYEVKEIDNIEFLCICDKKIIINQVQLLEDVSTSAFTKTVQQLLNSKSDRNKYPPALDPLKDFKLKDMNTVEAYYKWTELLQKMAENKCHGCVKLEEHMKLAKEMKEHGDEIEELKYRMSDKALEQMPDFQSRINVLKEIGCIDADLVVQIKGRVACEMNSGEELICTECLFDNQLDDLEPEEAVAIMSAFVFQQKNASEPSLTPKLSQAKQRLYHTAIRLGQLQLQFNLPIAADEYAKDNLKFGLVEVVYEWAKGTPFADICELTDVPEGMIVRTIVRLDETCREFKKAAAIMGNSALYKKMETAANTIKRDIVFAASLYITGV